MAKSEEGRPRRIKRHLLILGAGLALAAMVVLALSFRDTETPVTVAAAVEDFDSATTTTSQHDTTMPPDTTSAPSTIPPVDEEPVTTALMTLAQPGVYVYATTGGEETGALGGASHTYPAETTITVRSGGCGLILRWHPLKERFEEWETCLREGELVMSRYTTYHKFFGTDDRQDFECEPVVVLAAPTDEAHGDSTCVAGGLTEVVTTRALPSKKITVGSDEIPAVGVVLQAALEGDGTGTTSAEIWFSELDGTILSWSEVVDSIAGSVIGDVSYSESFELQLTSLQPAR